MNAATDSPKTALEGEVLPATGSAIAEYSATAQALATLTERYAGQQYEVTTASGMKDAREARAELRTLRTTLEATRKKIKAPVLAQGQLIDDEAKRITAALVALEDPIDAQIKAEETRKAEERAELERIEAERQAALTAKIEALRASPLVYVAAPVNVLQDAINATAQAAPDADEYGDRHDEAAGVHAGVLAQLQALLAAAVQRAEEAAEARAQQERLQAQQAELERQQAELKAQQDAAQAAREAADQAAADKRAEADRIAQQERDNMAAIQAEQQRVLDAAAAAERAKQQAELDRVAAEQRARDEAAAKAQQEAQEQAEREAREQEAQRLQAAEADRLEAEHRAIQSATLRQAAQAAVDLLAELGHGDHVITRTLLSALAREPKTATPRAKKETP